MCLCLDVIWTILLSVNRETESQGGRGPALSHTAQLSENMSKEGSLTL